MFNHQFIYIDESGDLGLDFSKKGTSRYFVITSLICYGHLFPKIIKRAVRKALSHKMMRRKNELKGFNTNLEIKKYFYKQLADHQEWKLVSIILNKKAFIKSLEISEIARLESSNLYDQLVCHLVEKIELETAAGKILFIIDRSKNKEEIEACNKKICAVIKTKILKKTHYSIEHRSSFEDPGLQAVDIFCWGIGKKYEAQNDAWYQFFNSRISDEEIIGKF